MSVPNYQLSFSQLGFWSGNFFLIAPIPDHCQLVLFSLCFLKYLSSHKAQRCVSEYKVLIMLHDQFVICIVYYASIVDLVIR